jgi:hypothetical protein
MVVTETDRIIDKLGGCVGEVVENLVTPGVREKFNDLNLGLSDFLEKWEMSLEENPFFSKLNNKLIENQSPIYNGHSPFFEEELVTRGDSHLL